MPAVIDPNTVLHFLYPLNETETYFSKLLGRQIHDRVRHRHSPSRCKGDRSSRTILQRACRIVAQGLARGWREPSSLSRCQFQRPDFEQGVPRERCGNAEELADGGIAFA